MYRTNNTLLLRQAAHLPGRKEKKRRREISDGLTENLMTEERLPQAGGREEGDAASKDGLVIARPSQSALSQCLSVSGNLTQSRPDRGHSNDNKHQPTTNRDQSELKVCCLFDIFRS